MSALDALLGVAVALAQVAVVTQGAQVVLASLAASRERDDVVNMKYTPGVGGRAPTASNTTEAVATQHRVAQAERYVPPILRLDGGQHCAGTGATAVTGDVRAWRSEFTRSTKAALALPHDPNYFA